MKSPIPYFGGKSRLAPWIVGLFPEHARYVEVFGGGASVLFARQPGTFEVYNDLDEGVSNFFWVLSQPELFPLFVRQVEALPNSRGIFARCVSTWRQSDDPVIRAARWYVVQRQSFSALFGKSWNVSVKNAGGVSKWLNALRRLPEIHARLQAVQFEHKDFRALIDIYDRPDTLFYCDPPYVSGTRRGGGYHCELSDHDHRDLVERILKIQGRALLSGYATEIYAPLERAGWSRREVRVCCQAAARTRVSGLMGIGNATAKQQRVEVVWANFQLPPSDANRGRRCAAGSNRQPRGAEKPMDAALKNR